jgi:hypothetical protein
VCSTPHRLFINVAKIAILRKRALLVAMHLHTGNLLPFRWTVVVSQLVFEKGFAIWNRTCHIILKKLH